MILTLQITCGVLIASMLKFIGHSVLVATIKTLKEYQLEKEQEFKNKIPKA